MTLAEQQPLLNIANQIVSDSAIELAALDKGIEILPAELVALSGLINHRRYFTQEDERTKSPDELANNPYAPRNEDDSTLRYDILLALTRAEGRRPVSDRLVALNSIYRTLRDPKEKKPTSLVAEA